MTDLATPPARRLPLAGTRNLRDVGGYPTEDGRRTRWRTLLRTDSLDAIPAASQAALVELGLRQVVDLRFHDELASHPNVFATSAEVRYVHVPLLDVETSPARGLAGAYRYLFDERAAELVAVVRALLAPDGLPAVVGCAAGKDRTGIAIALVLAALGVPREVIVEDYLLTGTFFAEAVDDPHLEDWRGASIVLDVPADAMEEALAHLDAVHGGAEAFLLAHGLTDADLGRLQTLLTEPGSADGGARGDR